MADKASPRKKWSKDAGRNGEILKTPQRHERVVVAKQVEPPNGYDDYLFLLQQKNRMIERVKLTDKELLEKERKEKGFVLYVNGANTDLSKLCRRRYPSPRAASKACVHPEKMAVTAEGVTNTLRPDSRSKSAPEQRGQRKNWNVASIDIQTARGEKMHLIAPDSVAGNYTEDFEEPSTAVSIIATSQDESPAKAYGTTKTPTSNEAVEEKASRASVSERVILTVNDIAKLRKSLEMSESVQKSICIDLNDESDIDEEIEDFTVQDMITPNDVIVLEFSFSPQTAPPKPKRQNEGINSRTAESSLSSAVDLRLSELPDKAAQSLLYPRKSAQEHKSDFLDERSEVLSAIGKENEKINHSTMNCVKEPENPETTRSLILDSENDLKTVEQRVLKMEPKQQRDLMKSLIQLEKGLRPSGSADGCKEVLDQSSQERDTEVHKVSLELMSNWGHKSLLGLTEISFFDEFNKRINVDASLVRLDGAKNCKGEVSNLFNNKHKTTKERNMFCCERSGHKPVCLTFRLEILLGSQINKVKIWNYNKSLQDLIIGVRRLRISIDDEVLYDGELDKGCGNPVFDYGKTVVLGSNVQDSSSGEEAGPHLHTDKSAEFNSKAKNEYIKNKGFAKRLHHPNHKSVENSETKKSAEMWIPLASTPEPSDRCKTRLLNRSTLDLDLPIVDSDNEHQSEIISHSRPSDPHVKSKADLLTTDMQKSWSTGSLVKVGVHLETTEHGSRLYDHSLHEVISPKFHHSTSATLAKEPKESTASKKGAQCQPPAKEVDSLNVAKALISKNKNRNCEPSTTSHSNSPKLSREDKKDVYNTQHEKSASPEPTQLREWLTESRCDQRNSFDDVLDSLEKWDIASKKEKGNLRTIFDEPHLQPEPSEGMPTQATPEADTLYLMNAAKAMHSKNDKGTDKKSTAAGRRKQWQQPTPDLEASWTSLDIFEKLHKGRLSFDGDALWDYPTDIGPASGLVVGDRVTQQKALPSVLESISEDVSDQFIIPELPKGQNLVINIKSTWGDKFYVGLNGIELFEDSGDPITVAKISADPSDINVLPEYKNDPRVVTNLIDGVNKTRDDIHMWLAPFSEGANHFICLTFVKPCALALMRIWNYNKSRIHSCRGAKYVEVSLDGMYIFKGEVAPASGGTQGGVEAFSETILFTTSEAVLDAVSRHDGHYERENMSDDPEEETTPAARPVTADKGERPHTTAINKSTRKLPLYQSISTAVQAAQPVSVDGDTLVYLVSKITLNFTETWGDPHYLGLTGLEVVSKSGDAIPLSISLLDANPRDLHILAGYESDLRTLDKLINGVNITVLDDNMWIVPFTEGSHHFITINFPSPKEVVGLRFWNYNKSPEDTYRGARTLHVDLDGHPVSPPQGFLLRKGPGNCFYDFAQELLFSEVLHLIQQDSAAESSRLPSSDDTVDDYVMYSEIPKGFVYQFQLYSTHGDQYYIGLNAIELYDAEGKKISLEENNIAAYPESVNVLEGIKGDVRTPEKLLLINDETNSVENMWLSPVLPSITNRLFVIFDYPQKVSMIKIWNYSKTPSRGVKDFGLLVDDLLVYNGVLSAARHSPAILPHMSGFHSYSTILFSSDSKLREKFRHTIVSNKFGEVEVQLTNNNTVISKPQAEALKKSADQALRPKTSLQKRCAGKRR